MEPLLFVVRLCFFNSHWIYTMYRCLIAAATTVAFAVPAAAQVQRNFPQNAMRGTIAFGAPPQIQVNGKTAELAPGSRIRGQDNLLVMSGALVGAKAIVNFTVDQSGVVKDVWILRKEEIAMRPWPETLEQTQTWQFDPVAQTWTKP
ncbi:MAG TPA: hypothetical protein VHQ87_05650 [Rhizobacter sp.]|nr:hypothetical protein [Rhizobacter sp.]